MSAHLLAHLVEPVHPLPPLPPVEDDAAIGDDFHLALYVAYELHYRGFAGVDDAWEWEPTLLGARRTLEAAFEATLPPRRAKVTPAHVEPLLAGLTRGSGPSLSAHMESHGTRRQFEEFAVHRSAYQLKEADPHTWALPRLDGPPKAAMVEIQADEYGGGSPGEAHADLFAVTLAALGLDPTYGAYLDRLPGVTLATVNLVSLLGLHRRHRGALVGHLALFEMTSVVPMARYSRALRRFGLGPAARRFYDVHVEADARHAVIASTDMAGALAAREPRLAGDIVFGAEALTGVEGRFTRHLLDSWAAGSSSLLAEPACRVA